MCLVPRHVGEHALVLVVPREHVRAQRVDVEPRHRDELPRVPQLAQP